MRIILASEYFYPLSKGGTEMYVFQLAKELILNGHDCLILSLSNDIEKNTYEGINIRYIPFEKNAYNELDHPNNLKLLIKIVEEFNPDIFHLHSYTSSMGINHLLAVQELGIKAVFSSHLPNFTCLRGDLMKFGTEVCDGHIIKSKCFDCYLHSTGIKSKTNRKLLIKLSAINWIRIILPRLNQYYIKVKTLDKFKKYVNSIVVVSEWQKNILEINGFDNTKLSVCRQAINKEYILTEKKVRRQQKLKIGFIGRIVKVKGLHLLFESLKHLNSQDYELHIVAIKSTNELDYYKTMREQANLFKANWIEDLESSEVFNFIDSIDILAIPSIWLETGPIVAFEALARKVPILTFNYGGAKELISDNIGYLVNSLDEMKDVLNDIIYNKTKLNNKSDNINYVRNIEDLFVETINVYKKINKQ